MHLATENHGDMSCEIEVNEVEDLHIGTLKYSAFEVGLISGPNIGAVRAQFQAICEIVDAGGMVCHGIILLGYHSRAFSGDVLLVDGELEVNGPQMMKSGAISLQSMPLRSHAAAHHLGCCMMRSQIG